MSKTMNSRILTFINWFKDNAGVLVDEPADIASKLIASELIRVDEQLGVEVSFDKEEGYREAIFTAFSDPSKFSIVFKLVDSIREVPGWKITGLKPPRGFSFKISVGELKIDASNLMFSPIEDIDRGFLLIISKDIYNLLLNNNDANEIAWLIVETGIGEKLTGEIEHLEFGISDSIHENYPITNLRAYIEKL